MRLFVAITLNDNVRSILTDVQARLKPKSSGVRWVAPALLHLTVKFLGDVPDATVPKASSAVERAASSCSPFEFGLSRCGCFPGGGRVRVVWIGGDGAPDGLAYCVESVESELESAGYPRETRRFSPHITLGRVREDRSGGDLRSLVEACTFKPTSQRVRSLTLMSSVLSPQGPTYTPVCEAAFGGE